MTAGKWYNSLRVQMVVLLSLALFPLGVIAVYQTNRVEAEAARNASLSLLALTGRAARTEEKALERAIGAMRFFSALAGEYINDPERCRHDLKTFVGKNPSYSFVGFLPLSGVISCSSADSPFDYSRSAGFDRFMSSQQRQVIVNQNAPISGESIVNVLEPLEISGSFVGYISVSIPHRILPDTSEDLANLGLLNLITINESGDILTAREGLEGARAELPVGYTPQSLADMERTIFSGENENGSQRAYTVVPILGMPVKVIGIWESDRRNASVLSSYVLPVLFPALMWISSMVVAILSVYMLVLRHRIIADSSAAPIMPNELQALENNFEQMTSSILREEAEMEDMLREKNVLIKEVHHRVKNNLQLISSIMNMKMRTAKHEETRSVLARLQDRVLSLATIHRDLYQSQNGGLVNAGSLLREIVENSVEIAAYSDDTLELATDFDPVWLYPDQVVPLSLLVAEGMTNAMKFIGKTEDTGAWVRVSLKQADTECVLTLSNSIGGSIDIESTGLGTQLINAFSIQLGGQIELEETATSYQMSLRFTIEEFVPEGRDF